MHQKALDEMFSMPEETTPAAVQPWAKEALKPSASGMDEIAMTAAVLPAAGMVDATSTPSVAAGAEATLEVPLAIAAGG